ncbi:hypothetical protein MTR67_051761 [Solanum verrucosum]|uniref:Uncharacterized protein n=1 Tax=Solanum verrucosum TaxID=315347 RepID=A0AAF0V849_SOLVR|nr:hypothetical protein MTR67_051761 [Solanum verrucosum]
MCSLLEKEVKFMFDKMCLKEYEVLKWNLIEAPILISPKWTYYLNSCVIQAM